MTRELGPEIVAFLDAHGASTSSAIAAGIRARRQAVDEQLLAGLFQQAPTPEGGNPRARYWVATSVASPAVPSSLAGQSRAALMLAALSDGKPHSRAEIFRLSGKFFLTNNASAELRAMGYDIRKTQQGRDVVVYRLAAQEAAAAHRARVAPSISAPRVVAA